MQQSHILKFMLGGILMTEQDKEMAIETVKSHSPCSSRKKI